MNFEHAVIKAALSENFQESVRLDVHLASLGIGGHGLSPWEIISAYVAALERRVADLERKAKEIKS